MKKYLLSGIALGFAAALSATTALADITIAVAGPITGQYAAFGEQIEAWRRNGGRRHQCGGRR